MAHPGQSISNARTGQRMTFLTIEPGLLEMESVHPATGEAEPEHVHPHQESSARVVSGELTFTIDGEEQVVCAGEEIVIPPGTPHFFANRGTQDAVSVQSFRPALRIAEFFETYFALAQRGELDARGMPSLLRLAVLVPAFADEIRAVKPPWPVQRATFAVLAPLARARGYAR